MGMFDDLIPEAPAKASGSFDDLIPKQRPSAPSGLVRGMRDPIDGGAQLLTHLLPDSVVSAGNRMNNWLADKTGLVAKIPESGVDGMIQQQEQEYKDARAAAGENGFDAARLAGNIAITLPIGGAATAPATIAGKVAQGAKMGAAFGAAQPVNGDEFWSDKGKQVAAGAAGGAIAQPVVGALARVFSPNAAKTVSSLKDNGVDNPTVGQALGGMWNRTEEKAQSLPIMGDMIARARALTRDSFNNATINKALEPISEKTNKIGHEGVAEAGDKLSGAYNTLLQKVGSVRFDGQFQNELGQLSHMASNLTPDMAKRFESIVNDRLLGRMAPNGGMLAETFKNVESEIGIAARRFSGSQDGAQQELGDALTQLQALVRQQIGRSSPGYADELAKINQGWANLVRVEGAAKGAKGTEGVFTPGQLLTAVRGADTSVRDRATARGEALMQDWATEAQKALGNKYPDSGTAGRLALGAGGVASGAISPVIPAALFAGAGAYTQPVQKALVGLVSARPELATKMADFLRKLSPASVPAISGPMAQAFGGVSNNGN